MKGTAVECGWSNIIAMILLFVTLWPWPFDLILIGGRGVVMDYLCAKFGGFTFSGFGFIMRREWQTESQRQMIVRPSTRVVETGL